MRCVGSYETRCKKDRPRTPFGEPLSVMLGHVRRFVSFCEEPVLKCVACAMGEEVRNQSLNGS